MKTELEPQDIEAIASRVAEILKPMLQNDDGKHEDDHGLMTLKEASEFLRTSKGQIYQWVNSSQHGLGTFPYYKAGKQLRFSKPEILKWLKSNTRRLEDR